MEQQLRRERRVSGALRDVGVALGSTLDLDDLLELILGTTSELLEAERATLYLLDEARGELVSRAIVGQEVKAIRLKVGHGLAGLAAQTGRTLRVKDAYKDPRFEKQWDVLTGFRTTSMLVAPLKNHLGRTIGVVQVLNKAAASEFSDEDEAMLAALSTQAAVAIDNSRLFISLIQKNRQLLETTEQLKRKLGDLELLFELEHAMARVDSLDSLVRVVLERVVFACGAQGAAVRLEEQDANDMVQYLYDRAEPTKLLRKAVHRDDGLLGLTISRNEPISLDDATGSRPNRDALEASYPFAVTSALILPLEGESSPLGAFGLFSKEGGGRFSDEDVDLMRLVAANVSTAVRLYQARQQRLRSERLSSIGRLLSQVIHDFKSPMTVVSGYVQLMAQADAEAMRAEYAEAILKQFDLLTAMQNEVLAFARGESNLFVRRVYLGKFFGDLTQELRQELNGHAVQLAVDVDTKAVARFDEVRVGRAVHNLVRNALEAMGQRGGRLRLEAKLDADDLVIRVADTGPGIPEEIKDRLFRSFVSVGKSGGSGLGLAIVKKIAQEHGGSVTVQSTPKGATFEMRLPQAKAAAVSNTAPSAKPQAKASAVAVSNTAPSAKAPAKGAAAAVSNAGPSAKPHAKGAAVAVSTAVPSSAKNGRRTERSKRES